MSIELPEDIEFTPVNIPVTNLSLPTKSNVVSSMQAQQLANDNIAKEEAFRNYMSQMYNLQNTTLRQSKDYVNSMLGLVQQTLTENNGNIASLIDAFKATQQQGTPIGSSQTPASTSTSTLKNNQPTPYTVVTSPKEASYNFMHLKGSNGIGYRKYNSPIEGARAMMHQLDLYFSGKSNAAKGYDMIKNGRSLGSPSYTPWGQQMIPSSYKPFANGVNPNTINHMIASGLLAPNNDNNNPEEYASVVSKRSGIGRDDVLDVRNREQMRRLLPAIAHMEGNPYASSLTPELIDSLYDRNSLANQVTKDLNNVAYYWGGRDPYSGKGVDCSGWTGYVLEQLGMPEYKQHNAADQIKLAEQKGRPVSVEELMNGVNMDGVLIGLSGGSNGKGKYKGIGHIVYTFKDPNTQQIMVTESSSGKGVHVSYLSEWLDNYVVKKKRNVYGVKLS